MGNSTLIRSITAIGLSVAALGAAPVLAMEVTGRSGGPQASDCGFVSPSANHTVQITEAVAPLNVEVTSSGNYSLLIESDNGFSECVRAHSYDGGAIESTGAVPAGTYRIYVGDFDGASHPFSMTVND